MLKRKTYFHPDVNGRDWILALCLSESVRPSQHWEGNAQTTIKQLGDCRYKDIGQTRTVPEQEYKHTK